MPDRARAATGLRADAAASSAASRSGFRRCGSRARSATSRVPGVGPRLLHAEGRERPAPLRAVPRPRRAACASSPRTACRCWPSAASTSTPQRGEYQLVVELLEPQGPRRAPARLRAAQGAARGRGALRRRAASARCRAFRARSASSPRPRGAALRDMLQHHRPALRRPAHRSSRRSACRATGRRGEIVAGRSRDLNALGGVDVIIVGRGGGSHRGSVGLQRRAGGPRHRRLPRAGDLRGGPRDRLHHRRLRRRPARRHALRRGRAGGAREAARWSESVGDLYARLQRAMRRALERAPRARWTGARPARADRPRPARSAISRGGWTTRAPRLRRAPAGHAGPRRPPASRWPTRLAFAASLARIAHGSRARRSLIDLQAGVRGVHRAKIARGIGSSAAVGRLGLAVAAGGAGTGLQPDAARRRAHRAERGATCRSATRSRPAARRKRSMRAWTRPGSTMTDLKFEDCLARLEQIVERARGGQPAARGVAQGVRGRRGAGPALLAVSRRGREAASSCSRRTRRGAAPRASRCAAGEPRRRTQRVVSFDLKAYLDRTRARRSTRRSTACCLPRRRRPPRVHQAMRYSVFAGGQAAAPDARDRRGRGGGRARRTPVLPTPRARSS